MEKEMKTENMPVFFLEIQRRGAQEVDKTKEKKKKRWHAWSDWISKNILNDTFIFSVFQLKVHIFLRVHCYWKYKSNLSHFN